jgi:hypothetical protein
MYAKNLVASAMFASLMAIAYTPPGATQNAPQQSTARQVDKRFNITFEPRACQRASSTRVNCDVLVTNFTDSHRQISFGAGFKGYQTRLVDTEGNVYPASSLQLNQFQRAQERVLIELAPGVPTRLSFSFRVPQRINDLAVLDLGYRVVGRIDTTDRISLPNIGAITSSSAQNK